MTSTSTSNAPILTLKDVNLRFETDYYRSVTWREAFTRLIHDPIAALGLSSESIHVARDVSFTVHAGERVGIVGVNGTGKTSLCRCIAGTYQPDSGEITIQGRVRAIFDTAIGIQPELTGRENAELLWTFMFPRDPDQKQAIEDALNFSELGKFLDAPYRLYSNGMQARLCLSLVAARPCDLLILDEVFDGADEFFREKISTRMLEVMHQSGAVLFISHSPDQIRRVCNRVIVLSEGRVAFDGKVEAGLEFYRGLKPAPSNE